MSDAAILDVPAGCDCKNAEKYHRTVDCMTLRFLSINPTKARKHKKMTVSSRRKSVDVDSSNQGYLGASDW